MSEPLLFTGLDGANPLAFLALLGVGLTSQRFSPGTRISWIQADGSWHPRLHGFQGNTDDYLNSLHGTLAATSSIPFKIDKKLPYARDALRVAMKQSLLGADQENRRASDLLAGFGSDAHANEKCAFLDTAFRMVRSGDSAGQGLSAYAIAIRRGLTLEHLRAALFLGWRYEDEGFSLRWDPLEDQRYALRWHDPSSQSNKKQSLRTVLGANALALEALAILPVQPQAHGIATTGFARLERRRDFFTWPIWDAQISIDAIRSVLSLSELAEIVPNRDALRARGIVDVYRSERIAPNQYYKNFTPANPA